MRLSAVLLVVSLAGLVGGAWLIGRWAVGAAIMLDSLLVGAYALVRDDGKPQPSPEVQGAPTLHDILDRARRAG